MCCKSFETFGPENLFALILFVFSLLKQLADLWDNHMVFVAKDRAFSHINHTIFRKFKIRQKIVDYSFKYFFAIDWVLKNNFILYNWKFIVRKTLYQIVFTGSFTSCLLYSYNCASIILDRFKMASYTMYYNTVGCFTSILQDIIRFIEENDTEKNVYQWIQIN